MKLLEQKYKEEIVPKLMEDFKLHNKMAVSRITKVTVNVGVGKGLTDNTHNELVANTLQRITGQKASITKARKSISAFKIREGMIVGYKVTLRGKRMYDFLNKLVNISFPRVRDFHGLDADKNIDEQGNMTIGFKEHVVFPEIKFDEVEKLHGLEVSITNTAKNKEQGLALFRLLGFPIKK
ncbi:MAG: 50S ribosomal protein L5 [Parcubacteria group bacterium CG1_02_37_51]|uniref:Large ribosomal subunit protein uL5 n=2 Tax=Candidatus Komeiliibacteriota TaxID=1817908 RepID=A0A2M8DRH6_9BACT|nr:MAG: 50S ribosomal protein L5 [Parcubacteria group bacterium CG1_02_37_51]PIY94819.1 MAG: 50S ribosomal protein L5 [Candidatus Komeilibacteria bacterium CG_4_10_14_0_8_um_filter_37_78]PJC01989.1 MAG: 50S ribosomal protein L5 [Candidatus Komeilibacteria bacterium CG_4_9_14_0_8_um_filter_36_9]